ncbi:DNA methyltransferase [Fibrobacterota bacterium]
MKKNSKQKTLFQESEQQELELSSKPENEGPVECLGMTFENDEKRREHFLSILREKLKDPEFRKIEGFPIGEDEDILALSDPPYYTACPNPFIDDFIKHYGKPYDPKEEYKREPFAADVSEGKNDPIYNVHSYHTKVPHKAIMRYILHYTEPGDIVFDGFCGTGMTGVAAQMCGDKSIIESLGYQVDQNGKIQKQEESSDRKKVWLSFSKAGIRNTILNDLSPSATFIAYNYNYQYHLDVFEIEVNKILKSIENDYGWMYETKHKDGETGKINYTVWSDVFLCNECAKEIIYWDVALNSKEGKVKDEFNCNHCNSLLKKRNLQRATSTYLDKYLNKPVKLAKQVPVLIKYTIDKKSYTKIPDSKDYKLIEDIESKDVPFDIPVFPLPDGYNTNQPKKSHGITHVHHFYTKRNLMILAAFNHHLEELNKKFLLTGVACRSTLMNRIHIKNYFFGGGGWNAGYLKGTLYISSIPIETSIFEQLKDRLNAFLRAFNNKKNSNAFIQTSSADELNLKPNSVDYIFIDPPFGANINYSELNIIWEAWLKVKTNNSKEAVENPVQNKTISEYRRIMMLGFKEAYRILKPGRWMTVEFSNTKASIWNSIQSAIIESGFIIANISSLDKKQGSFKAVTTPTAVKQDLVISAYKPNGGFEQRFLKEGKNISGVWDFVRTHMKYLPIVKIQNNSIAAIPERDPRILYDQLLTYYIRKGISIPISSPDFQQELAQYFPMRDNMYFLPEQVTVYDKERMKYKDNPQLSLFVSDESTAISWLRVQLLKKPQSFQEIHPQFIKELGGWKKNEKPLELMELLQYNFIRFEGKGDVPSQIHSYLSTNYKDMRKLPKDDTVLQAKAKDKWYVPDPNKAGDLEKIRKKALLKEFEEYRKTKQKRLKIFRLEAMRAGFEKAWQEADDDTIIQVAEKIPENVLQEDQKLLMWYDMALTRRGD